ncbi:MAG: gas vesicle protein K [Candidatus Riflebacteria bacterium]|nr:gas vesicle protein K [Candidatus Riflebacteria bacterium]
MAQGPKAPARGKKNRIDIDPENVRRGLGQLVLTIVELLRQLLERQAIRRVEAGSLTDGETERLGCAFRALKDEMVILRTHFGLTQDDLNLDLGPFGKLL